MLSFISRFIDYLFSPKESEETPYLKYVLIFQAGVSVLELYLDWRQRKCYTLKIIPNELEKSITQEKFDKAQAYGKDKNSFSMISEVIQCGIHIAVYATYCLPRLWNFSVQLVEKYQALPWLPLELRTTLLYFSFLFLGSKLISLPFSLYSTFVLEERYGFNKTTLRLYIKDTLLGMVISAVIGYPTLTALWYVLDRSGPKLWLYFWLFTSSLSIGLAVIYPPLIMPLFNKFEPLQDDRLQSGIQQLANQVGFPLQKIYVMDGSKRSSHSNAFMYGIWKKGIVLYDSLLEQNKGQDERILAVLAHELGHWKMRHTQKTLVLGLSHTLLLSWLYGNIANNESMYHAFGFSEKAHIIGLLLFSELLTPMDSVLSLIMNYISRRFEYAADQFAKGMGYASYLKEALIQLHLENLSTMYPDPWYSVYHNSHPTLTERIKALENDNISKPKIE